MSWKFNAPAVSSVQRKTLVILDNGHHLDEPAKNIYGDKYSPEWSLKWGSTLSVKVPRCSESTQNRILVNAIVRYASMRNIHTVTLYPETTYVSRSNEARKFKNGINERIARIKEIVQQYNSTYDYIYLVSIHTDGVGSDGKWYSGQTYALALYKPTANGTLLKDCLLNHVKDSFEGKTKLWSGDYRDFGLTKQSYVDGIIVENGCHSFLNDVKMWVADEWIKSTSKTAPLLIANKAAHPFYVETNWVRQLANRYVDAFLDIESNYRQYVKNKANSALRERAVTTSRQGNVIGTQNTNPQTAVQVNVPFRTTVTMDDGSPTASLQDILKKYYDFTNEDGKRQNGSGALNLDQEIDKFLEDNWIYLYARIPREIKLEKMNLEKASNIPVTLEFSAAKNKYSDLVDYVKENIPTGQQFKLYRDKMIPVILRTKDEEFLNKEVEYANPHMLYEVAQHNRQLINYTKHGKLYPKALAWVFPQSSAVFMKSALSLTEDIISCSFTRNMTSSQFVINLAPVKAVFVKGNKEAYGAWRRIGDTGSDNAFKGKAMVENLNFFYDKVLSPGDVVYISIADNFIESPEKVFPEFKSSLEDDTYEGHQVDFIGVIDSVKKSVSISQFVNDSVVITGKSLIKFYETDSVFFQTANMCYSAPALKNEDTGKSQILQDPDLTRAQEIVKDLESDSTAVEDTLIKDRVANTSLDLAQMIDCASVTKSLHRILDKLKILSQEYRIKLQDGTNRMVPISEVFMRDFDINLIYRTYYSSRLATMEGTIIDFIKQLAPPPFVEFFSDTYPSISKEDLDKIVAGTFEFEDGITENRQDLSNWKYPDDQTLIENENSPYKWQPSQIFHLIIRNTPLSFFQFDNLCAHYSFEVDLDYITSLTTEVTDAQMFSAFQVIPRSLFIGDKVSDVMAFPPLLFAAVAKRYGFRFSKIESSYFATRVGTNKTDTANNGNMFLYAEKDLRIYTKYALGNAFYEKGRVTTIPLRHIHPGMVISIPMPDGKYVAYIKSVKQVRDKDPKNSKTEIEFERGMLYEGHKLLNDLVEITTKEDSTSFTSSDARDVKFYLDVFDKLMTKRYALNSPIDSELYKFKKGTVNTGDLKVINVEASE